MNKYVKIGGVVGKLQEIADIRVYSEVCREYDPNFMPNFMPKYIVTIIEKDTEKKEQYCIHDLSEIKEVSE